MSANSNQARMLRKKSISGLWRLASAALLSTGLLGSDSLAHAPVGADRGRLQEAAAALRALKDLTRESTPHQGASAENNLGPVLRAIAQRDSGAPKTGEGPGTTPQQTDATSAAPKNASAYYDRGDDYAKEGDLDRAIADFDKAIDLNPKYASAYIARGVAYGTKGDFDRAIADYSKAIELDPKMVPAYLNRGIDYGIKGDLDRAIADYDKAIQLNPTFAFAYNDRGNAYQAKGDLNRAIADYDKVIELIRNSEA